MSSHKGKLSMANTLQSQHDSSKPTIYKIRIKGQLDSQWTEWFEGLAITLEEDGNTLLTGPVIDQSALHGLLKKIRDLGVTLISICPGQPIIQTDLFIKKGVRNEFSH
jgi:hypothetical protein